MALYHKLDVENGFANVLQFLSLISDSLDGVEYSSYVNLLLLLPPHFMGISFPSEPAWNISQTNK